MKITKIKYSEGVGKGSEWILEEISFGTANLVVGKNSTGKSRLLSLIRALAGLLEGKRLVFDDGSYEVEFVADDVVFEYKVKFENKTVAFEFLARDGVELYGRDISGFGRILFENSDRYEEFRIPSDVLVATGKRDLLQHPYLEQLHGWANNLRFYEFGSSLGRENLARMPELVELIDGDRDVNYNKLLDVYTRGYSQFGKDFDESIIRDLGRLGYDCTEVGINNISHDHLRGASLMGLYVQESGLPGKTFQTVMSQGMFRALGMVIHLNFATFNKLPRTVLVDDIGEGLDFERASSFVNLLIERSVELGFQLFMTTNDRFVMNGVPLEHWCVLERVGSLVKGFTEKNAGDAFDDFRFVGLSNFDFFSGGYFNRPSEGSL